LCNRVREIQDKPASPLQAEFRARPLVERKAASIYGHVDGEEGPKHRDVVVACLRALSSLLGQSNAPQISAIMLATFDSLDKRTGWEKPQHCTWLARHAVEWTAYQYRYAVPTLLVEHVLEIQDTPIATPAQHAMLEMITSVFTSPAPLVNLSTSDIISNLISMLLRRVCVNPDDELLPEIVECIAALGTHVYYADQIQDLAGELIARVLLVEARGVPGRQGPADTSRAQALRCLLLSLVGLWRTADRQVYTHDGLMRADTANAEAKPKPTPVQGHTTAVSEATIMPTMMISSPVIASRPSRRAKIGPEVWQDTLTLMCDGTYGVRADYVHALIAYLQTEIPKDGEATDGDGVRRSHALTVGPTRQASTISAAIYGDSAKRFLNAMHGYVYLLATARTLGHNYSGTRAPSRESPLPLGDATADSQASATESDNGPADTTPTDSDPQPHRESRGLPTILAPRVRKNSMTQRMVQNPTSGPAPAACASDYAHLLSVLARTHEQLPVRGLLTGVPMLIALGEAAQALAGDDPYRARTIEEVVARTWLVIGKVWECAEVISAANTVSSDQWKACWSPSLTSIRLSDPWDQNHISRNCRTSKMQLTMLLVILLISPQMTKCGIQPWQLMCDRWLRLWLPLRMCRTPQEWNMTFF
jgi:protein EFR3